MGDMNSNAGARDDASRDDRQNEASVGSTVLAQADSTAFHSQLQYTTPSQPQRFPSNTSQYEGRAFDMSGLAATLPATDRSMMNMTGTGPLGMPPSFHGYQSQPQGYARGLVHETPPAPRAQQQQQQFLYGAPSFGSMPHQMAMMNRQPIHPSAMQYPQFDPNTFGMSSAQYPHYDPRMASLPAYGILPQMPNEYGRRASEPGPTPAWPRGPPRKPRQSGHALWVGNLPPNANVTDLKDHFSRDATRDIESLFLISKSNCAFVNYRSEAACVAALTRHHDGRFQGVRLVCRLRRGSAAGSSSEAPETSSPLDDVNTLATPTVQEEHSSPTIVGSSQEAAGDDGNTSARSGPGQRLPERYFIVKSLTAQDLEASVRNGIWATQAHNEKALNEAYDNADNVFLIFSANKSGEYFGYARMASTISGEPVNLSSTFSQVETQSPGTPQSIPTPATATAPRGRIIDDSGRGTIFWEAEHSDNDDEGSPTKGEAGNDNWGRQFHIQWQSTTRLPFYRTRGLRNPWNANREIKIARDGTELEPSVGRRLIQMFHRPPQAMPYQ